jgi:hypothetical protein
VLMLLLLLLLVILVQSSSWVGGLVIHDLSVRASSCCSTSKMAAGLFCLFNQPPHLSLFFFLSFLPWFLALQYYIQLPDSRPFKLFSLWIICYKATTTRPKWCDGGGRVSIHRPSNEQETFFSFFFG